jgi:hypothetical protein
MVQSTFFPRSESQNGPIYMTGFYQPASECGGDLWGHFELEPGVEFFFIGDAMGHGAPAALVTAMAYSTTMTIADVVRDHSGMRDSPARVLERMNRIIHEAVRGTISMTFFACVIDTKRGLMTFANAGHNFPVIIPTDRDDPRAPTDKRNLRVPPISLKLRGTPLGMDANTKYHDKTIALRPGDKVLYFTDGLIECSSPKGEVWGRKYLIEQAVDTALLPPTEMKDELLSRAFTFFANKPLDDDVTAVVVEIAASWQVPDDAPPPQHLTQTSSYTRSNVDLTPGRAVHPVPEFPRAKTPPPRVSEPPPPQLDVELSDMPSLDLVSLSISEVPLSEAPLSEAPASLSPDAAASATEAPTSFAADAPPADEVAFATFTLEPVPLEPAEPETGAEPVSFLEPLTVEATLDLESEPLVPPPLPAAASEPMPAPSAPSRSLPGGKLKLRSKK